MTEEAVKADDSENLYGAGPYELGRFNVDLKMAEATPSSAGTMTEGTISAQ